MKIIEHDYMPHEPLKCECVACGEKWELKFPVEQKQLICPACKKIDGVFL